MDGTAAQGSGSEPGGERINHPQDRRDLDEVQGWFSKSLANGRQNMTMERRLQRHKNKVAALQEEMELDAWPVS